MIMSKARSYGDAVAHSHGLSSAPSLVSSTRRSACMAVTKIAMGIEHVGMKAPIPPEDTFIAALYLSEVPYNELWKRGRPYLKQGYAANALRIVNLESEYSSYVACPHRALSFYIPRAAFEALTEDGGRTPPTLSCPPGVVDPVIADLGRALVPALERPVEASSLFVDHVFLAILAHLAHRHGGIVVPEVLQRGGLSMRQERRAKEYLASRFGEDVALIDVANACGLSRDYFIRAFRRATGLTPHRWLQRYRIARAKDMLLFSKFAIAEIAVRCGFADQSHLTRTFRALEGTSPAAWRRQHAAG
jgi:AraC family transcriptional regulator